jgi:hypothetical protein
MMTQRPLKFLSKFIGNSLPEFPTFPHTEDEIYGNTAESQAKTRIFLLKEGMPEKFSKKVIIGLRHAFQESSPQPNNPLMQYRRILP